MVNLSFSDREQDFNKYTSDFGEIIRIDPPLAHNVLSLVQAAKNTNGDVWIIVDGEEGAGKTTLVCQLARLVDSTFNEKKIEFSPEDLVKAHFKGLPETWDPKAYMAGEYSNKPWEVLDLDESAGLDRKKTMGAGSIEFTGFTTQSRQLHKIVFCTLPSVHILNSYIAEHRAVALIHVYKHERSTLGFYKWYSRKHLKLMFLPKNHTQKLYPKSASFQGRFNSKQPFDMTGYDKKKAGALNAYRKVENPDSDKMSPGELREAWELAVVKNAIENDLQDVALYKGLGMPKRTWFRRKEQLAKSMGIELVAKRGPLSRLAKALGKHNPKKEENNEEE